MNRHRFGPWWKTLVRFLFAKRICISCTFCRYSSRGITLYHQRVAGSNGHTVAACFSWLNTVWNHNRNAMMLSTALHFWRRWPQLRASILCARPVNSPNDWMSQSFSQHQSVLNEPPVPEAFAVCRNNLAWLWASEHASIPITQGCKSAISSGSPIRDILVLTKAVYHPGQYREQ